MTSTLPGAKPKSKIKRCEFCPYGEGRAIPPRGNPQANIVVVGEAPGSQELFAGQPFVGKPGQLILNTASKFDLFLNNENTYYMNALRCVPPRDDGPIQKRILTCCQPNIHTELEKAPRQLILLMGNSALRTVTGDFNAKITRARGIVIDTPFGRALPMFHPAAILRTPSNYYLFERDMEYAAQLIEHGEHVVKSMDTPPYEVLKDNKRFDRVIRKLLKESALAADIETTGLNWGTNELLCIGIRPQSEDITYILPRKLCRRKYLKTLFEQYEGEWIWHNGKFDTLFLEMRGIPARVDHDTMLMHYTLDEQPGRHGLKQLSADFLGAPAYDQEDFTFENETPELHQYLSWDVKCTLGLYNEFAPKVEADKGLHQLYRKILIPASEFLRNVERRGMYVNREYLDDLESSLSTQLTDVHYRIAEAIAPWWDVELYMKTTGANKPKSPEFNPGSPQQLKWLLYDRHAMGMRAPKGYKTNTEGSTLENLHPNPVTPLILESRGISKRLSTYVRGVRKLLDASHDNRLHPSFSLHTTETGRLSSSGPNAQNFPRGPMIRNMIQAPEGRRFIEMDYSQAELRTLAWISNDPFLRSVYERGEDLHSEVARQLNPDYDNLPSDEKAETRVAAKGINFGIAYGLTAEGLMRDMPSLTLSEAQSYIQTWLDKSANAAKFLNRCRHVARTGGTITTPFGRKRRFGPIKAENIKHLENEASNFPIQSVASDLTLLSAINIQRMFDNKFPNTWVINIVHDSILIETDDDDALCYDITEQSKDIMRAIPKQTLNIDVPFESDSKEGYRWGDLG